jgi:hypothetical protein
MDLFTIGLLALAAIVLFVVATHKSKKTETVAEQAPYKVETPEAKVEAVNAQPVEGAGIVEVPVKAKKAPAKKPAPVKAPAKAKAAPAKKAPAKKPAATKAPAKKPTKPKATK